MQVISPTSKGQYPEDLHSITLRRIRKIAETDYSFVMSVCLSVRTYVRVEQLGSLWKDFCEILYLTFFEDLSRKFKLR